MAQKLKFNANPTFKMDVFFPVAGEKEPQGLTITFHHLTPKAFADSTKQTIEELSRENVTSDEQQTAMVNQLKLLIKGWAWDEEVNEENLLHVMNQYPAFYNVVTQSYGEELWKVREKN